MKRLLLILLAVPLSVLSEQALTSEDMRFFDQQVGPLLEQHCFPCHSHQSGKIKNGLALDSRSGWALGGDSGPAVVPGDPEKSLLIRAIRYRDPDLKMPPKQKLSDVEIAILEDWVKGGAPDTRVTAVRKNGMQVDSQWWSLKPLTRPPLPASEGHPIDAFISARLKEQSITAAPEADRRTLMRRLSFDLHGLPPAPEEVDAFVADPDARAYDKLVERLLDSPRFGERWARHWLDTIHFADTHGFEHDLIRTNAWRYRDYVIESFNRDIPWPRFIREQLAADVFFPEQPRLTVALGFIGAGPWDHSTAQTAPKTFDYLDRDDMVTQTMSTFASATVHCARCHDHKFDPISQEDYYAVQAVFAGVGKGDLTFDEDPARSRERRQWQQLLAAAEGTNSVLLATPENARLITAWEAARGATAAWTVLEPEVFLTSSAAILKRSEDGAFVAEGPRAEIDTYTLIARPKLAEITAIRLEVLSDARFPMNGPGRPDNGNLHLSEFEVRLFPPGAAQGEKLSISRATADFNQDGWTIAQAIDGKTETAWGIHPREGESHFAVFELATKLKLTNGAQMAFQLRQLHGRGHLIGKFRLALTADPPAQAAAVPALVTEALRLQPSERSEAQRLIVAAYAARAIAQEHLAALPPPTRVFGAGPDFIAVTEGNFYKPWKELKPVRLLQRGDLNKPGELVAPGALSAIAALPARFALATLNDEGARRAALADWLADPKNPLTWRSIVNRVWQYHFGRGLSDSPNDFGRMGGPPSHPELLDWLATEFRDGGGSLKALHRLIVTSAAYRRADRPDDQAAARDPEDRLLWRSPTQRLDAESYRDAVLAISDRLDLAMGGPGIQNFKLGKPIQLTPTVDFAVFDWNNPGAGRRSIYRFVYRCIPDPFMDALDFPDAAQLAPTRPFSSSALQTLALLNDDFVLFHSQSFATRLAKLGTTPAAQVRAAFRLVFQREPTESEGAEFTAYAAENGVAAMCRVLLNSNEFLFVN